MDCLVRLAQAHESFRRPELEALARLADINIEFLSYSADSPFCVVRLPSEAAARTLISRSILTDSIHELWGSGIDYESLHADVHRRTQHSWPSYKSCSFKFRVLGYQNKLDMKTQLAIIETFSYLGFEGPIRMKGADHKFNVMEHYELRAKKPREIYFGRWIADGGRDIFAPYDLKKREYISTTSMDSELAFITANIAMAGPGRLFYDPFVGTGSFPIACSHFGAMTWGSDIDGRSIRGTQGRDIRTNFDQYGLSALWLGGIIADLTNTPLRVTRFLDGIVCDPPYGVREGLRVLGRKDGSGKEAVYIDGVAAHLYPGYIHPKKSYSFDAMMDDILEFAALTLVDGGRLAMWMPSANEENAEHEIPRNASLELVAVSVQAFNKWSRRLLTYARLPDSESTRARPRVRPEIPLHSSADLLNSFRRRYFQSFKPSSQMEDGTQIRQVSRED